MAEDKSNRGAADTIFREALGRIAQLGDLYDATTDKFCRISMLREHLPPDSLAIYVSDSHHSEISTTITCSLKKKLDVLGVTADLSLSVLAGLIKLEGAAKYLNEKKTSFKSVECALVYNVKTVVEKLNILHEEVKNRIDVDALTDHRATHVVVEIHWGANCTIRVMDQNSEDEEKKKVEGNLMAEVGKLNRLLSPNGETGVVWTKEQKENWTKFSLGVFGDVLLDSFGQNPTTVDGVMEMIRNLPRLIQKSNNSKGKPLTYVMFPLSSPVLRNCLGVSHLINKAHRKVDQTRILKVIRIFDDLSEITQKAYDQLQKMNTHSHCVTASELKEARSIIGTLEDQEASLRSDLEKDLEAVRSGNIDSESLTNVCHKHRTAADETFQTFEKIYNTVLARIYFAERCIKYGAKYLTPPVDEQIQSACDDYENVYVLFDGEADGETTQRNHSAFIELAKMHQNDSSAACYVTRLDQSEDARIEHYRQGNLLRENVATELEDKGIAKRINVARPALRLEPFKARCPGSFNGDCSQKERSWTCSDCNETLQFCLDDAALYCSCGKAAANEFEFRCRSDAHGSHFMPCSDEILQTAVLQHYATFDYKEIKRITGVERVCGVTSVDDELFVLLPAKDSNQVAVYSINDYRLRRHLHLPGLKPDDLRDLTSCVRRRCLYMSDYDHKCIHRYDLARNITSKWTVRAHPRGLSVTPGCNLLVTCREPNKLFELSADSDSPVGLLLVLLTQNVCVREIALQSDIQWLRHGVQLTTGQYVVCHGLTDSHLHRVCIVDDDGRVTRSYGGECGSDVGQLSYPCHVAVDEDSQFIYVADCDNDRVVLLSPTLEFVRYVSDGLSKPHRLHLHHTTRRLYVGQRGGDVVVIQL